jgi:acyl carrier protein
MSTIGNESIRTGIIKILLSEGKLSEGAGEVDESMPINTGMFRIDSLALIRAFIAMEDAFDVEFGDDTLMQNRFSTFGDVIAYVVAEVGKQAS